MTWHPPPVLPPPLRKCSIIWTMPRGSWPISSGCSEPSTLKEPPEVEEPSGPAEGGRVAVAMVVSVVVPGGSEQAAVVMSASVRGTQRLQPLLWSVTWTARPSRSCVSIGDDISSERRCSVQVADSVLGEAAWCGPSSPRRRCSVRHVGSALRGGRPRRSSSSSVAQPPGMLMLPAIFLR